VRTDAALSVLWHHDHPLDDDLDQLLRRMRLPHMRRITPEVLATAKAQRWDPAEVLRTLLAEEVAGRERSSSPPAAPRPRSPPVIRSTPGTSTSPPSRPPPRSRSAPWNIGFAIPAHMPHRYLADLVLFGERLSARAAAGNSETR
jgi:hypothetical protein